MHKSEGMRGFFKGNGATVAKIAPFSALEFYYYEIFKNNLYPGVSKKDLRFHQSILCGGITGVVASTLTYPMDLVKTYLTINESKDVKISMTVQLKIILK